MKRSVMVNKLANFLNNISTVKMTDKMKADVILGEIERLGMHPPQVLVDIEDGPFQKTYELTWDENLTEGNN